MNAFDKNKCVIRILFLTFFIESSILVFLNMNTKSTYLRFRLRSGLRPVCPGGPTRAFGRIPLPAQMSGHNDL